MLFGGMILFFILGVNAYSQDLNTILFNIPSTETILWIVLSTLLAITIFYFMFSSRQIKQLKKEQIAMQKQYEFLEESQHTLLENMGENIYHIAKQTFKQTTKLVEKSKKTVLHSEIQEVMQNENELLDATGDLIQFMQLKSKKIIIKNEECNLNHILNETIGLLSDITKQHHTELIFDVSKNTPHTILTDSSYLSQILVNVLKYYIQHTRTNKVRLHINTNFQNEKKTILFIHIEGSLKISNIDTFFDTTYDEKSEKYTGLSLFIAKELVTLMQGELSIIESQNSDNVSIQLPIKEIIEANKAYTLDTNIINKNILIVDTDNHSAIALEKRLTYFNIKPTIKSKDEFHQNIPKFDNYDIVMLNEKCFTPKIIHILELARKDHAFKIIAIVPLYDASNYTPQSIIDSILYKPFSPEYIFELLTHLYASKTEKQNTTLTIHKEPFLEVYGINLDDFSQFQGNHLLLVEDNLINQKLIKSVLSKSHLKIDVTSNGEEALSFLEDNPHVDFILMDINMPIMDGYTATEHIRKQEKFDAIPIVALTALIADYEIVKMFSVGMNGYLSKPINLGKLYSALNTFLSKKEIREDSYNTDNIDTTKLIGLNAEDGLASMHHNTSLYKEVLSEFIGAYEKSDIVFDLLIKNKRYAEAKKLSLDIKGLADTIGAKDISELSNDIYNQLIYHKYDKLEKSCKKYATLLDSLKDSINIYLKNEV